VTRLTTCSDAEMVAARAAEHVQREVQRAREARGRADVGLSGGDTPRITYERLAAADTSWEGVEVWFVDERCVPPEDDQSNYRLAAEALLAPAAIPAERVHRMRGELAPEPGAQAYARELSERLPPPPGARVPVLDVLVLGIGPEGHVASLFPDAPALRAGEDALCLGVSDSPKPPPRRITLSLAVLRAARGCLLIATGEEKAGAIAAMLGEPTPHVPASLLARERLTVIVDDAAAPRDPRP